MKKKKIEANPFGVNINHLKEVITNKNCKIPGWHEVDTEELNKMADSISDIFNKEKENIGTHTCNGSIWGESNIEDLNKWAKKMGDHVNKIYDWADPLKYHSDIKQEDIEKKYSDNSMDIPYSEFIFSKEYIVNVKSSFAFNKKVREIINEAKQKGFKYYEVWMDMLFDERKMRFYYEKPARKYLISGTLNKL